MKKLLIVAGLILAFTACKKENDLTIANEQELTQTAFADEETTKGFTFTAKSDWTATVKGVTISKGSGVSWLTLLHKGVETYSGGAGTFTMEISLQSNSTGQTRTATIEIVSGKDKITISVTQSGASGGGTVYLVSEIYKEDGWSHKFEYDNQNRITKITMDGGYFLTLNYSAGDLISMLFNDSNLCTFTKNGNKITIGSDESVDINAQGLIERYCERTNCFNCQYQGKNLIKMIGDGIVATYTYDDKKSPFYYCNTPEWWLVWYFGFGYAYAFGTGGLENNIKTWNIVNENEDKTLLYEYTYNGNGFPLTVTGHNGKYMLKYEKK